MFTSISWAAYIETVLVLLLIYYPVVAFKFYGKEMKIFLSGKKKLPIRRSSTEANVEDEQIQNSSLHDIQSELFSSPKRFMPSEQETDDTFEQVLELTAQLKEVISEATSKNYIKEEFTLSLQLLIRKYQFLKGSPFMVAINNLIVSECEKHGYHSLDAEERVMLWNE
jgi:hypothetical protein